MSFISPDNNAAIALVCDRGVEFSRCRRDTIHSPRPGVCVDQWSGTLVDWQKTHEVRACDGDNCLYVVLKASVKPVSDSCGKFRPDLLQPNRGPPGHAQGILPISCCVAWGNQDSSSGQHGFPKGSQVLVFSELLFVRG